MRVILFKICSTTIIFLALLITGCSNPSVESIRKVDEIIIDGSKKDWQGTLNYLQDEKVAVGISNDNDFIYFCLTTSDKTKIMKILRNGFTVWLDSESGEGKTIGIQYPIRKNDPDKMNRPMQGEKREKNENLGFEKLISAFKVEQNEFLIVNKDNFPLNAYPLENNTGLEVSINYEMSQFVYELKVPMGNNDKSNVYTAVLPNEIIKVGFESGEVEKPERSRNDQNSVGGASRGKGGRKQGGRGGMRGGSREVIKASTQPIDFWMEVKLADKN